MAYSRSAGNFRLIASAILLLSSALMLGASYLEAWHAPWFEQRLLPSVVLAHGQRVYHMPGSGPLIGCTYAPFSYLAFVPTAVLHNVLLMFAASSLLATALVMLPLFLAIWHFKRGGLHRAESRMLLLFAFAAVAFLRPLNYITAYVTADSPAICLMALALLVLYWNRERQKWTVAALSSLCLAASVGCKQNMLVAALVILIGVFIFFSRRFFRAYLVFAAVWSALALVAAVAIYGDLRVIYFNNVTVPRHFPSAKAQLFLGAYQVYQYGAFLVFFVAGAALICAISSSGIHEWRAPTHRFRWTFFAVAAALIPSSVATYAALGGDANSYSHFLYFLLLGGIVTVAELMAATPAEADLRSNLGLWTMACGLLLLASGLPLRFDPARIGVMRQVPPALRAYRYDRLNPGEVYFPSNTIAVYMAEKNLYQSDWGMFNLIAAGEPLDRNELFRYVPEKAKYFAFPKGVMPPYYLFPFFAPHLIPAQVEGLDGFNVYLLERN